MVEKLKILERNGMPSHAKAKSVMGYFRAILLKRPDLLDSRSNDIIIQMWLDDHPGYELTPKSVRNTLANLKSALRKRKREQTGGDFFPVATRLEQLEMKIDDALSLAKTLHRQDLNQVIQLLRRARNEIVWKLGQ